MRDMNSARPDSGLQRKITRNRGKQSGSALPGREPLSREPSSGGSKSGVAPSAIDLQIDELVLTGFSPRDRFHIADAVERELAHLLMEKGIAGLSGRSLELESVDAGRFKISPDASAHLIGKQAAQMLHRQLSQGPMRDKPEHVDAKKP